MKYLFIILMIGLTSPCFGKSPEKTNQSQKTNPATPLTEKINFSAAYLQGGIYFGGQKTPADFSFFSLDYLHETPGVLDWGLNFGYLVNQSAVKNYSLALYVGGKIKIAPPLTLRLGPQIGIGIYHEQSEVQDAAAFGWNLGAKASLDYQFSRSWSISGGYTWNHFMYADSFWGKDIFKDVVLDFTGPQVSIGYSF